MNETCSECGTDLPLKVLKSAAGYYLGHFCPNCGPYGRVSGYFGSEKEAEKNLKKIGGE